MKSIVAITYFRALVPTYTLAFRSPYTLRIIYAFIYLKSIAAFIQPNPRSIYASKHPWHILPHHSDQMSESLFDLWRVISRFKEVITYKYPGSWRLYQVITNKITQFAKAILSLTTRVVGVHVWLWLSVYGSCNEMRWWGRPAGDLGAGRIHYFINDIKRDQDRSQENEDCTMVASIKLSQSKGGRQNQTTRTERSSRLDIS